MPYEEIFYIFLCLNFPFFYFILFFLITLGYSIYYYYAALLQTFN